MQSMGTKNIPAISGAVLELNRVSVTYDGPAGPVQAVQDVSLSINPGEIVGLVGESGCGKSTLAQAIMRLLRDSAEVTSGTIRVAGQDVYALDKRALRKFRWKEMSMVFQSAMTALNPVMTVEQQIVDVFTSHVDGMSKPEARRRAKELLDVVRIDTKHLKSYPHELSGGMRQRVVIAIAIALQPKLVIMDEPTTALDVVVQRSILQQIQELQRELQFAVLFISHDFNLVAELASRMVMMYAGRIVETGPSSSMHTLSGHHPYTVGLLNAIPKLTHEDVTIEGIPGNPPDLVDLPSGCAYHPRCPLATEICTVKVPNLLQVNQNLVACHAYENGIGVHTP